MTQSTKIQWTEKNWNPVRGCRRVSEGCRNCYAEKQAGRFCGAGQSYDGIVERTKKGPRWTGEGKFMADKLDEPLRLRKPSMIFVNSMSDLFFEEFTFSQIAAVFGVMAAASKHTFQVLTKRPERALEFFEWLEGRADDMAELYPSDSADWRRGNVIRAAALNAVHHKKLTEVVTRWPLPNVWLGVSAENQDTANARVPLLLEMPAEVRFVSAEPLLGPINFTAIDDEGTEIDALSGDWRDASYFHYHDGVGAPIDWIIAGGESGPGARACEEWWIKTIVEQGYHEHVPIFVKQLGSIWAKQNGADDRKGGEPDEWPEELRVRQMPEVGQ